MAKSTRTIYICGECGHESGKWLGRCPNCESWNTFVETTPSPSPSAQSFSSQARAISLHSVDIDISKRISTGIGELDRVLGGGIVLGSTILLGGDPGIGKSTLLMQTASKLGEFGKTLYVTGEESAAQLKLRAQRLNLSGDMMLLAETDISSIESEFFRLKPDILIIDSIQTMYSSPLPSVPGSVTQVREATTFLTRLAKSTGCAVFIVGHVTKDGAIAGPRVLEHMVDTVLYFEGDRHDVFRLLRAVKNRFGSTNEIGVFEMRDTGMAEITDPSMLFLTGTGAPGCAVTCALEGTRPMLVEVQALLSPTTLNNPRRMATGMDHNRLSLLLAVLEKKAYLSISDKDVYTNVVGGLRLDERASDLAICMCIVSALLEKALPAKTIYIGEVALTGEIRPVGRLEKRLQECERLGYQQIVMPKSDQVNVNRTNLRIREVSRLGDVVKLLTKG